MNSGKPNLRRGVPIPYTNHESAPSTRRSQSVQRGHRTRRLNKANKPFDELSGEAKEVQRRIEAGDIDRNDGKAQLDAIRLRKDLELAKDRRTEVIMKLEEVDVRAEFEELKRELGIS
jgi:hypothetical protein